MEEIGGRKEEGKAEGCHYTIISKNIINKKRFKPYDQFVFCLDDL